MPAAATARAPVRAADTRPRETHALERAKERADRALPPPSRGASPAPRTQLFTGPLEFDGMSATSNALWAGYTPPDPTGSIGPPPTGPGTHPEYVEIVNSMVAVYDATDGSTLKAPTDLQTFFRDQGLTVLAQGHTHDDHGDSIFDVQVQWDDASQRWLIATDDEEASGATPNHLVYGWSKTDDPTGGWCLYRTPGTATFDDYPKLGHDDTHLLIGTNEFASNSETSAFVGSNVWTVATPGTAHITTCDPTAPATQHPLPGAFTPVPVNISDASATGYVVATSGAGTQSSLRLYSVDNTGTVSASTPIPVRSFSAPPNVQQPGTADTLDSQDGRLTQAVSVGDKIWTQHTVRGPDGQRAEVRWYELDPAAADKLVQEGSVSDPSNSVFNASISPTADGHDAALQYNVGGRFHLVEVRAQTRRDTVDSLGTMENELRVGNASADIDQDFSCDDGPSCRWGDYSGESPDPSTTDVVWGTNQLNGPIQTDNDPSWITRNFALQFGGPDPAPDTTADGFPFTTPTPTPAFNFASSETGSTFRCSIDGSPFAACTPGQPFGPPLGNGTYTFAADATDTSGQPDPTPAQGTFTVAAPPPDTAIDSGPPATGNSRTAAFAFHSSKPGSSFQCSFDGSPFAACGSPFTTGKLSIASHAFAVRAVDAQGNVDPTPATSFFKVLLARPTARVRSQRASRSGRVGVRVTCPAVRAQSCAGTITFTYTSGRPRHTVKLATHRFRVSAGRTVTVHVTLTRSGRKLLQRKRRLRVVASIRFTAPVIKTNKPFRLSAPRRS